jgi:hypothetical protein
VVFIVYLIANVGIVVWRDWRRTLLVAVAAALVTIALALIRPPPRGNAEIVSSRTAFALWRHPFRVRCNP